MALQELVYTPVNLRVDGKSIDHLDFGKAKDAHMLVQMLTNAIYCAEAHCRKDLLGQARAFSGSICQGFEYAEEILGAEYNETSIPKLKQTFEALKSKYKI